MNINNDSRLCQIRRVNDKRCSARRARRQVARSGEGGVGRGQDDEQNWSIYKAHEHFVAVDSHS